ncbi:MAG: UDP-3-O-(3-hydroxymyristoyl)glucosamine N-acyltransferase [Thalassotalea sp.]
MQKTYTLGAIAKHIGATVEGDENCLISSLATLLSAQKGQIAFLANSKYKSHLDETSADAVILSLDNAEFFPGNKLVMKNPYLGFALTAQLLDDTPLPAENIHPSAVIDASATLGANVAIGANAVIEADVVLADDVVIGAGCFIGKSAQLGQGTKLWANVSVYHKVIIGKHCLVQAGTVIGSDGFGYANDQGKWLKIPQLGSVVIGDHVEIGAGTTIDRGALDDTIIENGVIIDNQIQIAHNVIIGENTAIASGTAIAGSTKVGKYCTIAGCVAIAGHLTIADKTIITGNSMVIKSITESGVYSSGMPSMPNREWLKNNARINKLDKLTAQVKSLASQLNELQKEK